METRSGRKISPGDVSAPCESHRCRKCGARWQTSTAPLAHDLAIARLQKGLERAGVVSVSTGTFDVADLLALPPWGTPFLIEVKSRKAGRRPGGISTHQARVREFCRQHGYGWATVWVIGEVRRVPIEGKGGFVANRLLPPAETRVRATSDVVQRVVEKAWSEVEQLGRASDRPPNKRASQDAF